MGKFDDSIAQYRKALSIDPNFVASHFGISADLLYMGKPAQAENELQQIVDKARSDGEVRTALFGMAVVAADGSNFQKAAQQLDKEFAVAQKKNDMASMSADLQAKGNILAQTSNLDQAQQAFDRSLQLTEASGLSQEIKDNAKLIHHYNLAGLDISRKDFAAAKQETEAFRQGAANSKNPALTKQAHELEGRIALAEKDYDKAIAELQQANLQNPQNLYRLSLAYQAKGDTAKAKEFCAKAADFNSLPAASLRFRSHESPEDCGRRQSLTEQGGEVAALLQHGAFVPASIVSRHVSAIGPRLDAHGEDKASRVESRSCVRCLCNDRSVWDRILDQRVRNGGKFGCKRRTRSEEVVSRECAVVVRTERYGVHHVTVARADRRCLWVCADKAGPVLLRAVNGRSLVKILVGGDAQVPGDARPARQRHLHCKLRVLFRISSHECLHPDVVPRKRSASNDGCENESSEHWLGRLYRWRTPLHRDYDQLTSFQAQRIGRNSVA